MMNLTMPDSSKLHLISSIASHANQDLIAELRSGKNCKVTVDNIDGRLIANQVCSILYTIPPLSVSSF